MVKQHNDYYTYAYLREDKTPYYIGKGRGKRIYCKNRTINAPTDKSRIIFLKKKLTEAEAFKHEVYMIAIFGRKDLGTGCLRNRTNGGDGVGGRVWTNLQRKKASEKHLGKRMSAEARRKMSEAKKGVSCTEETKRKMSIAKKGIRPAIADQLIGTKWWVKSDGTRKQSKCCPGEGWKLGMIWKLD